MSTSTDKKKSQERPAISPAKGPEEEWPSKGENNNCSTPTTHHIKDHDPTHASKDSGLPGCEKVPQVLCQDSIRED